MILGARGTRIGVALGRSADGGITVSAVGTRGDRVEWRREQLLDPDRPIDDALGRFMLTFPRRLPWILPRVAVALGPTFVQLKRLPGLPPLSDSRLLSAAVRESAPRFFLRNGIPIEVSGLRVDGAADAWGAATERPLLGSIEAACRRARVRLVTVVPTGAVLASGVDSPTADPIIWIDGGSRYTFTYADQRLVRAVRDRGAAKPQPASDRLLYAAALGVARRWRSEPIAWRPTDAGIPVDGRTRRLAWGAAIAAIVVAGVIPGVTSTIAARRATVHLRAIAPLRRQAIATADSLRVVTAALDQIARFAARRRPATSVLAGITSALPPTSAVVALDVDTLGGTFVALTPDAGALVTRMSRDSELGGIQIVGPVTREAVTGPGAAARQLERVAVRFTFAGPKP